MTPKIETMLLPHIEALDKQYEWHLSDEEKASYLTGLPPVDASENERRRIINYHHDHKRVASLQDNDPETWQAIAHDVSRIISHYGRQDQLTANSLDDLIQMTLLEIIGHLQNFRYDSSLRTWIYVVTRHTYLHYLRKRKANKRETNDEPYHQAELLIATTPIPSKEEPETQAIDKELRALIAKVLDTFPDSRVRLIFELSVYEEYTLREIGAKLNLSAARVGALLQQARQLLSQSPEINEWFDARP